MRIILLAFFLTFTWAVLAKDEGISYKVTNVKTHSRIARVLVLDVESDEYGHENMWVYFNGENHSIKSLELFENENIAFVSFANREGRTVFNSDEVKIYNESKRSLGVLHKKLPRKSIGDRFNEVINEGIFRFN